MRRTIPIIASTNNSPKKKPATHCFKASSILMNQESKQRVGVFTGYSRLPDVSPEVLKACVVEATALGPMYDCTEPELTFSPVCPTDINTVI